MTHDQRFLLSNCYPPPLKVVSLQKRSGWISASNKEINLKKTQKDYPGQPLAHRRKERATKTSEIQLIILLLVATLVPRIFLIGAKGLEGWPVDLLYFHGNLRTLMAVFLLLSY